MSQWDSKSFHNLVLERDKVCQGCGSTEMLQAHHVEHRAKGGEDDPANGICLCAGCHADEHPDLPHNLFFIKAFGPFNPDGWTATYVAGLLNCHPRSIVRHARALGIERHGHYWSFTEDNLVTLRKKTNSWEGLEKEMFSIYLPVSLKARLDEAAAQLDRSRTWCVVKAVETWLEVFNFAEGKLPVDGLKPQEQKHESVAS